MQPIGSYGWAYGYPKNLIDDGWQSNYANVRDVLVEWDYNKVQVTFSQEDASQMFIQSNFARTLFDAKGTRYQPSHLVIKSPSEHTINGAHYDIEMQVYHQSTADGEQDVKQAATAIMFSVEDFDPIDEVSNKTF